MPDGSHTPAIDADYRTHTILDRLPSHILGGLSVEQRAAIAVASGDWKGGTHRVNLRVSVPFVPKRWYLTVLGGPERRTTARRKAERVRNPVRTASNMAFIFVTALTFYSAGAAVFLFSSSVLQY